MLLKWKKTERVKLFMWDLKDGQLAKVTPRRINQVYVLIHCSDPADYAAVVATTLMSLASQCLSFSFCMCCPTAAARGQQ